MKKGKLSIARNHIDGQIFVTLEDKETGNRIVQIEIAPENFAKAITGLQYQLCDYQVYQGAIKGNSH